MCCWYKKLIWEKKGNEKEKIVVVLMMVIVMVTMMACGADKSSRAERVIGAVKAAYNTEAGDITWEKCTLRKYLNDTFYNQFAGTEKGLIIKTKLENKDNPFSGTKGGNGTEDYLFLLSIEEINLYCFEEDDIVAKYDGEAAMWWLRSPGGHSSEVSAVPKFFGNGMGVSGPADADYGGVRPALWINLNP